MKVVHWRREPCHIALFAVLLLGQAPTLELCIDRVEYHNDLPYGFITYTVRNPSEVPYHRLVLSHVWKDEAGKTIKIDRSRVLLKDLQPGKSARIKMRQEVGALAGRGNVTFELKASANKQELWVLMPPEE